jgi:hypothetical protein
MYLRPHDHQSPVMSHIFSGSGHCSVKPPRISFDLSNHSLSLPFPRASRFGRCNFYCKRFGQHASDSLCIAVTYQDQEYLRANPWDCVETVERQKSAFLIDHPLFPSTPRGLALSTKAPLILVWESWSISEERVVWHLDLVAGDCMLLGQAFAHEAVLSQSKFCTSLRWSISLHCVCYLTVSRAKIY